MSDAICSTICTLVLSSPKRVQMSTHYVSLICNVTHDFLEHRYFTGFRVLNVPVDREI